MKCFAVVAVVVVVALAVPVTTAVYVDGNGGKDVFKFKIEDYEPSLLDSIISLKQKENAVQLKSYKFKNCGNPKMWLTSAA
ncbi:hypothetical protein PoB_000416600 [Plakobranchus ocellatus]|uniref:Uncharacterized protein n=1 Tax=Plakobranchus ocellatus TaxID=259542 RepID=A0AAV3XP18_9GAST|nr:hypothetical protein PoB_000416600 [Plakobranchus ocellatus]